MADLFQNTPAKASNYSAKDIEVLEGLEPVRRRPGMYIGGTDERALHHLVAELLDNAMDEAVAGHATRIEVELSADGSTTVRDNGRGIPVDPHKKFKGKSALEVILTTLHSGAKFSQKAYQTSGGLHGVGVSVVNALSERLLVEVARDRLVHCVVQQLGHEMVQGALVGAADVHARAPSDRLQPLQHLDVLRRVVACLGGRVLEEIGHVLRGLRWRWRRIALEAR